MKIFSEEEREWFTKEDMVTPIADRCGCSRDTVQRVMDMEFSELKNKRHRRIVRVAHFMHLAHLVSFKAGRAA